MSSTENPENLFSELRSIRGNLEQLVREDSSTKRAFDTLYQELQQYKSDFLFQFEKGLLTDLLSFYDSMIWFENTLKEQNGEAQENFSYLMEEFYEVLRRRDVLPAPITEELDRKIHRVVQIEHTEDQSKDNQVANILRRGFFRGDKALREEEITLYRYKPSDGQNQQNES